VRSESIWMASLQLHASRSPTLGEAGKGLRNAGDGIIQKRCRMFIVRVQCLCCGGAAHVSNWCSGIVRSASPQKAMQIYAFSVESPNKNHNNYDFFQKAIASKPLLSLPMPLPASRGEEREK